MSATPPGPLAITAAQRVGSARAGPVSLGGSVPAVERATMDFHIANVSAHRGHPRLSLIPVGCRSSRAGLLEFHSAGHSPGDLVKMQVLTLECLVGASESAFLLRTQMMPMPGVHGVQSE